MPGRIVAISPPPGGYRGQTYTVGWMMEETRRSLLGMHRAEYNQLGADITGATPAIQCQFTVAGITKGSYIAIDEEIMYVWTTSPQTNQITQMQRGMLGTLPAAHKTGAIIEVNPRFPRFAIRSALNEEIRSWGPQVYRVKQALIQTVSGTRGYDLMQLVQDNFYNIISVRRSQPSSTSGANVESWPSITNWQIVRPAPVADFPSGAGLVIPNMFSSGVNFASPDGISMTFTGSPLPTLMVNYSCPFDQSNFIDSTDLISQVGLDATMIDIPPIGAAWRLLSTREILRTLVEAQGQPADLQFQPPMYIAKAAQALKQQRDGRLNDVQVWLLNRYGIENWGL